MNTEKVLEQAAILLERCRRAGLMIATAESCTGGLIAAAFTEIPGSSDVFERGFVSYSNAAKSDMLGIDKNLIATQGAVSEATARAMAEGALANSAADISIAVTGIAGPGGGTPDKPVGLVHLATARLGYETTHLELRMGTQSRHDIRQHTVLSALALMNKTLDQGLP